MPPHAPLVSIVIPVLDDADELTRLLSTLSPGPDVEVIVADGDGRCQARGLAVRFPSCLWIATPVGRGVQMNAGAARGSGRWLLFAHADVCLPGAWLSEIQRIDRDPSIVGGSFRFALDSPVLQARLLEKGVALRVRWFGLPYGDQALFVRRDTFQALGGYRPFPLMEDVDFVRRVGRAGKLYHSSLPVLVSARRWEAKGWIRCSLRNLGLLFLFGAGVSPERLARMYYGVRSDARLKPRATETTSGHP